MRRASGVLMHISSLYGNYSSGSFSKSAFEFIDFLSDSGFSFWQVLPFCVTDDHNSPYASPASEAGNPYFVDLEALFEQGLLTSDELSSAKQQTPYSCEFERLKAERFELLKKASKRADKKAVLSFIDKNPKIQKACEFLSLKEANDKKGFLEWDKQKSYDEETLFTWQFIQYHFFKQWQGVKDYAASKNVKIIGDLPFYVSFDSSDVYFNKEDFLLDGDGKMRFKAGVPPDYFAKDGQLWGNPIYDFEKMQKDGFTFWKERLKSALNLYDCVRIDHFRAFSDYWSVPADAQTAKEGQWQRGPREKIIDALKSVSKEGSIIAENLGIIDDDVNALLDYSGFPGMSVFQFGFDGNFKNPHLIHNFKENLVAYTGTHDNNTLLGFMWELDDKTRRDALSYIGFVGDNFDKSYDTIIRLMLMSRANLVVFPIQDLLGYGSDTRLNTPGKAEGNWSYRITREQLMSLNRERFLNLNRQYSRI